MLVLLIVQVFFLLVKERLAELGVQLNVASVISDFELNIIKAVDDTYARCEYGRMLLSF